MSEELHESNESCLFSPIKSFSKENKEFYKTSIKKKKSINDTDSNNQNILINLLKNFSVKYELEEKNKQYKFVLSFDELISLIRFSLQTQMKLNTYISDESENLKTFSQDFINNLTYYIYSYEKVEKIDNINANRKDAKKFKSPSNKENYCPNTNNVKNNKIIRIINKRTSDWADRKKLNNNQNIKEDNKNNQINMKKKHSTNSNNCMQTSMSYVRRKKEPRIFSAEKTKENNKKKEKTENKMINRSVERKHNSLKSHFSASNNKNLTKEKKNINTKKRKDQKTTKNKNENKNLSIFSACENLKSSSFIINNKSHDINSTEQNHRLISNESNNILCQNNKKNTHKIIYYNQNMMFGIKKKIITNNVPKPSNLANKLLQNGRKYITEFNGIEEEERKKQYYK